MNDMRSLSRFTTPEMASYFSDQLADLAGRNLRNVVSAVRMERGDLSEGWREGARDYATVAMRYSMIDVTTDLTGRVVDGSPDERQVVTELWTFMRPRGGGWILSAIQQRGCSARAASTATRRAPPTIATRPAATTPAAPATAESLFENALCRRSDAPGCASGAHGQEAAPLRFSSV